MEVLQRYGADAVNGAIQQIMDSSEAVARKNTVIGTRGKDLLRVKGIVHLAEHPDSRW
ncbi:hypothetical protein [Burkholderia cepacia]|uniref:hypothetical protein n=1 Tax=Burkholderia cepacia TaxID=292 RepID=UPI00352852E6